MKEQWNVGKWRVDYRKGTLTNRFSFLPGRRVTPDNRLMRVFEAIVQGKGEIVTTEQLLEHAWPDRVVSRDSVTTAVYQLRQLLGDHADNPSYIRSEPRRGYRLVAKARPVQSRKSQRVPLLVSAAAAGAITLGGLTWFGQSEGPPSIYVEPLVNYAESPVQEPLFTAIETTFSSELIQIFPGQIKSTDVDDAALRLQSMMVACDLGPALVVRLMDTRTDSFVWSNAYSLEEAANSTERPSLVERAAYDVGVAVAAN